MLKKNILFNIYLTFNIKILKIVLFSKIQINKKQFGIKK